jgi:hypothetical protein
MPQGPLVVTATLMFSYSCGLDCDMGIARARLAVAGGWAAALVFLDDSWQDLTAWTKPS